MHRTDDRDGVLERSACGFGSSANGITITLLKTGTYTVMVFDGSSDEMGTYAILLDHADATGARTMFAVLTGFTLPAFVADIRGRWMWAA